MSFTPGETLRLKAESLKLPMICVNRHDEIEEVITLDSIVGMSRNKGTPTELTLTIHNKLTDNKTLKYQLVQK